MTKDHKSEMRERMIAIRKHFGLNQKDFANKIGCHRNRISDIERGLREAPKNTILALCTALNIDLNWFILGVGAMFQDETECQPSQSTEELDKQIELLEMLIEEKERLLEEKEARIKLLGQILDL